MRPSLSIGLCNFAAQAPAESWDLLVEQAVVAERAGFDRVVLVDHVVMGANLAAYDGGRFPTGPDGQWLEPLTTLAVMAGATSSIRLATGVMVAALRRPVVLAKAAATLSVLSHGRLELGVGVGWQAEEYQAAGLDFARRGDLLDDTLGLCRALWDNPGPVSYRSGTVSVDDIWCEPRPSRPIRLWIGGRLHRRCLERIVRYGDGWIPWLEPAADLARSVGVIRDHLAAAGRSPEGFGVRARLPAAIVEDDSALARALDGVPAAVAAGVTDFSVTPAWPDRPQEAGGRLARIAADFREAAAG